MTACRFAWDTTLKIYAEGRVYCHGICGVGGSCIILHYVALEGIKKYYSSAILQKQDAWLR